MDDQQVLTYLQGSEIELIIDQTENYRKDFYNHQFKQNCNYSLKKNSIQEEGKLEIMSDQKHRIKLFYFYKMKALPCWSLLEIRNI